MSVSSQYTRSYTSFSGSDIVATFDGYVIGELQAISYSVTREKAPIYTMGSPDPRSFSRGKRGIAGSLVFTVFDKDTLLELKQGKKYTTPFANSKFRDNLEDYLEDGTVDDDNPIVGSTDEWEDLQQRESDEDGGGGSRGFVEREAYYVDEIPPFDITITMQNEYGQAAKFAIVGVEILNEGSGMSIDDITTERACTFVARAITPLKTM